MAWQWPTRMLVSLFIFLTHHRNARFRYGVTALSNAQASLPVMRHSVDLQGNGCTLRPPVSLQYIEMKPFF